MKLFGFGGKKQGSEQGSGGPGSESNQNDADKDVVMGGPPLKDGEQNKAGGSTSSSNANPPLVKTRSHGEDLMPYQRKKPYQRDHGEDLMPSSNSEEEGEMRDITRSTTGMNRIIQSGSPQQVVDSLSGPGDSRLTKRRNSQDGFDTKAQTIMVFDWDDTLFPTTWVRHYMGMHWKYSLDEQPINAVQKKKIKQALDELSAEVEEILKLALTKGKVVIVTLAKIPWVGLSCENFFPRIAKLLKEKDIRIVYAQEAQFEDPQPASAQGLDAAGQEAFWIRKKQLAISNEVRQFYSQYAGQSWKNVISIGDSDFERKATHATMTSYKESGLNFSRSTGAEDVMCVSGAVGNHYRRLRTKTVKMYDSPRIKDLELEIQLLRKWLPALISLDGGLDVDLEDDERLAEAHRLLTGEIL